VPERYDPNEPQILESDPAHPDLGWTYAEPIPYHTQKPPKLITQILLFFFRRYKCQERWCFWPATELGWYCDRHAPGLSDDERP
jgi:hypothetical protein